MVTGYFGGLNPNRHDLGIPKNNQKYDTPCDPINTHTIYQAVLTLIISYGFTCTCVHTISIQPVKRMTLLALNSTRITRAERRPFTHIYKLKKK